MVQGRPDRVRMTMFPEESVEVPSTQMMPNQQNNLQRMSQSTQILQATLSNLAAYQVRIQVAWSYVDGLVALFCIIGTVFFQVWGVYIFCHNWCEMLWFWCCL